MFERQGHRPKVEEATSISGNFEGAGKAARNERGFAIRKANFAQTIRDGSIELIFVPVLDLPAEWQGTMIARLYNEYNQVAVEEVFNLVMVRESTGAWAAVYELAIVSGAPYIQYESGMFGAFALGVTIADHPAVTGAAPATDLQPWQLWQEPYPCPYGRIDPLLPDCNPSPTYQKQSRGSSLFRPARYDIALRAAQARQEQDRFPARCGLPQGSYCPNPYGFLEPRIRRTAYDAFPICASAGVVYFWNLPRFLGTCGTAVVYQAGRHIFRIW